MCITCFSLWVKCHEHVHKMLHTHVLYSLMCKFLCRTASYQMWRILPNRCRDIAFLGQTSVMHPPPASKMDPRYLKHHEFLISISSHFTFDKLFCISLCFSRISSLTAVAVFVSSLWGPCACGVASAFCVPLNLASWRSLCRILHIGGDRPV